MMFSKVQNIKYNFLQEEGVSLVFHCSVHRMSNTLGLAHFPVRLVNSDHHLPDGQVEFLETFFGETQKLYISRLTVMAMRELNITGNYRYFFNGACVLLCKTDKL